MKQTKKVLLVVSLVIVFIISVSAPAFATVHPSIAQKISESFSTRALSSNGFQEVIVELNDEPVIPYLRRVEGKAHLMSVGSNLSGKEYGKILTQKQITLYKEIMKIAPDAKIGYRYQYTYNGFALKIAGKEIQKIAELKGIKKIFPTRTFYATRSVSVPLIGAPEMWKMKDSKGNPVDGTGMLIGIIDTGIDYKHPDLGGGFGPDYKVIGGYDFGDKDSDPMDEEGHGTHVAGIAAGDGTVKGVAPKAKLMAYKIVSGSNSSASDSAIIAAIERAVKDKCDAVNLSFGSGSLGTADPDDPENKAFDNAADAGVLAAVAAGNQGSRCISTPYPLGSPSGAPKVISVAASDDGLHPSIEIISPEIPEYQKNITGNYADLSPKFPADKTFEVVACGYGRKSDFYGKDVKGKIALVSRGPKGANALYFRDKDLNAEDAGAAGVIIYNNLPGIVSPTFQVTEEDVNKKYIPAIFVTESDGMLIKGLINKGLKIKFTAISALGTAADFTSMGPTSDFYFKPEVSAPGVAINSTVPGGKYATWSGTSMATPHVTGAICLIKQLHPDWTSEQIKAALMNTATILKNYQNDETITWTLQGSGRINIPNAANTTAVAEPYDLLTKVKDLKPFDFTVTSLSSSSEKFDVSTEFTLGLNNGIEAKVSKKSITVPAGGSAEFSVTFDVDTKKLAKGPHEGVIYLTSKNTKLHIPFIVWNGDVEVPKKLSNVTASSDTITPAGKESNEITFHFTLGSGSLIPPAERKDRPTNSNIIDEMQIRVTDMDNNELGIIYEKSLLLLGDYTVTWDGRDVYGNYFLNDGTYKWVVAAVESNNDENNPSVEDAAKVEGEFKVVNAPKTTVSLSTQNDVITQEETTNVSVNISTDKEVNSFNTILFFNPNIINVDNVTEGDFFKSAGDTTFSAKVDNTTGEIFVNVSLKNGNVAKGKGTLITFTAKGRVAGDTRIGFKESSILDKEGNSVPSVLTSSFITVNKAKNPWDLNRDKKVDEDDLTLFEKAFGSEASDSNYLPLADFNEDGIINGKDLIVISMHYGETYP